MKRWLSGLLSMLLVAALCLVPAYAVSADGTLEENEVYLGDTNGDGVDSTDARFLLQVSAGLRTVTADRVKLLDLDRSGEITAMDARWALQIAAGLRYPIAYNTGTGETQEVIPPHPLTAAEVADIINRSTAAAVQDKAGYDWSRKSHLTESIDLGLATDTVNGIIQNIDPSLTIDEVVGPFLGVGEYQATVEKGEENTDFSSYPGNNYCLKATSLRAEDLGSFRADGDVYTFTLPNANSPKKDNSTAFSRLTNDLFDQNELSALLTELTSDSELSVELLSLRTTYSNIRVRAVITDGVLQELSYSYDLDVRRVTLFVMNMLPVSASGALTVTAAYTNFVY